MFRFLTFFQQYICILDGGTLENQRFCGRAPSVKNFFNENEMKNVFFFQTLVKGLLQLTFCLVLMQY